LLDSKTWTPPWEGWTRKGNTFAGKCACGASIKRSLDTLYHRAYHNQGPPPCRRCARKAAGKRHDKYLEQVAPWLVSKSHKETVKTYAVASNWDKRQADGGRR
jgi:hypothetical protein